MLIVALVLAVVGLAALVTAVVTSNELVAWVCIGASVVGVILLIIDAIRERQHVDDGTAVDDGDAEPADAVGSGEAIDETYKNFDAEYPDDDEARAEPVAASEDRTETFDTVSAEQAGPDGTPRDPRPDSIS
jgi:hypothetical protein